MTALTKDAIKQSFMKLINQKPLSKITVKEIAEDCKINRNSFYYHYNDIPALVEEILNEQVDELVSLGDEASIYECIIMGMDFALQNKKAAMHIYNSVNKEMFELYINRVSQRTIDGYMELAAKKYNITDRDREVITMYYKSLIIGFMFNWLNNGMNNNLTDDLKRICELFEGNTELVLGRCDKKEE
jgi:AcrR family transcriptional regulator